MTEDERGSSSQGWGAQTLLLYDSFVLRDCLGYVAPGVLFLCGSLRFVQHLNLLNTSQIANIGRQQPAWVTIACWVAGSYIAAVFLRLLGATTRLLVSHLDRGLLGDPWRPSPSRRSWFLQLTEASWRGSESRLRPWYEAIREVSGRQEVRRLVARESVVLHLTGHVGLALVLLGLLEIPLLVLDRAGGRWFLLPSLLAAGLVLLAGHYRHAMQLRLLVEILNGRPSATSSREESTTAGTTI